MWDQVRLAWGPEQVAGRVPGVLRNARAFAQVVQGGHAAHRGLFARSCTSRTAACMLSKQIEGNVTAAPLLTISSGLYILWLWYVPITSSTFLSHISMTGETQKESASSSYFQLYTVSAPWVLCRNVLEGWR
jgi:hypothetical protein